jgi:hypothetical protein
MKLPITRIVLYKHGVGYFEREGDIDGEATLSLTFKQKEVSDVLKSLTVLDLGGGHITSVSYDSTKPLEQMLADVAINIPDHGSLVGLLPQIKGARVSLHTGVADPVEGMLLGIDTTERQTGDGVVKVVLVSVLTDGGGVQSLDLHALAHLQILDESLRKDLDFYLRTQLTATKKDARVFTFFAQGEGQRRIRLSYTLEAPVWKATYRILLGDETQPPMIQGWAVVDNTSDEDWEDVSLSLISGLPVSFVHDLYTPRYIRRPEVRVKDTTGVLPPEVEEGVITESVDSYLQEFTDTALSPDDRQAIAKASYSGESKRRLTRGGMDKAEASLNAPSSTPSQVRERVIGDFLEYQIEHPVTIRRNQSALVPIVLRGFDGKSVLLYNRSTRKENPMSAVLFKNTTGLTLEGGPVTVLQEGSYVGEAMLDTMKPDEERLIPYAVELSVRVMDNMDSYTDHVYHIRVKNGNLTAFHQTIQQTTYTLKNKSDKKYTVYLDHSRVGGNWELFGTPEPHEITDNYWRFRFELAEKQQSSFVVKQRFTHGKVHSLGGEYGNLGFWLKQRYLDESVKQVLAEAMRHKQELAQIANAEKQLEQERATIYTAQQRIRENLQALGDRSAEKDLRERFVRTLNTQEDRLEEIDRDIKAKIAARDECRQKIKEILDRLEYDAPVNSG